MSQPIRIVTGGIHHESNSFTPLPTSYADFSFERGVGRYADEAGALAPFDQIDLVPTFVASAQPGGLVQRDAYEHLKAALLTELAAALPADGLLLDLHGAMEADGIGDGESDLLRAVRVLVGDAMPIAVSLDLHGNISRELVAGAQILTAYRTAPHRDTRATRRRALQLLVQAVQTGARPVAAMVKLPLVLAGEVAVTDREPARALYARLPEIAQAPGILDASLLIGCAWTDSPFTAVSAIVVAERDHALAQQHAAALAEAVWQQRAAFGYGVEALEVDAALDAALASPQRPVFVSDGGDNVTAGATGDVPALAARLITLGARDALVAGICDAEAVHLCLASGVGATVELAIGGRSAPQYAPPLAVRGVVEHVPTLTADDEPGTLVVLRVGGVRLLLALDRRAFTTRAAIAASGVDPMAQQLVVVKQGYLFPDLADHAPRAILALSPGATDLRLERLPYQRLVRPVFPLDPAAEWAMP